MKSSQFDAKTFGVGELITQRKLFRVPLHQRSYAWEQESVAAFLSDIYEAYKSRASDYFIGLVVVQGPENGEWVLLDGQQRLTTASLIFSSIRFWLATNGLEDDAQQINHEYLGVRRLGGDYSSRMMLNAENQQAFSDAVVELSSDAELKRQLKGKPRRDSNRLLLEAAVRCREWVREIAKGSSDPAATLYDLARFLDTRVKVVCVDVSTEVDAYILFESLNDRGVELSAMDLIKNHIISRVPGSEAQWTRLIDVLGELNPDDFLKVFWTSRYGLTQKSQIFRRVKEIYNEPHEAEELLRQLIQDAELLGAIEDDEHPVWLERRGMRDQSFILSNLGSKQARPIIIAALRSLSTSQAENLLWQVIVGVVRFQVVGRGRTGVVEKAFGRLCQLLSEGHNDFSAPVSALDEMFVPNREFVESFEAHVDSKYFRIAYLLAEIAVGSFDKFSSPGTRAAEVRGLLERRVLHAMMDPVDHFDPDLMKSIGNFELVDIGINGLSLTTGRGRHDPNLRHLIRGRARDLAEAAATVWVVPGREG